MHKAEWLIILWYNALKCQNDAEIHSKVCKSCEITTKGEEGGGIGGGQLNCKFMRVWQRQYGGHGLEKTMSDNDEMGPKLISKAIKEKTTKLYS